MKTKSKILGILLAATLCMSACAKEEAPRPELLNPVNATLETAPVEYRQLSSISLFDGKVLPAVEELSFDRDGYLYGLFVSAGDEVNEGEVLATIVGADYNTLNDYQSQIDDMKAANEERFKYLESELELARLSGGDTAELELQYKHEKEIAELKLTELREKRNELRENGDIGLYYIESPADCRVLSAANLRQGAFVGKDVPLVALETKGNYTITCEFINEKTINSLNRYYALINGKEYELEYIPYSKQELKDLSAKDIIPDSKFVLVDGDDNVTVGDYAKVITVSGVVDNVLAVPVNAVYSDSTGRFVYEVVDNVRVKRPVKTGISDSIYIEILEGISDGGYVYVKN